jgi:hypothetical protein
MKVDNFNGWVMFVYFTVHWNCVLLSEHEHVLHMHIELI